MHWSHFKPLIPHLHRHWPVMGSQLWSSHPSKWHPQSTKKKYVFHEHFSKYFAITIISIRRTCSCRSSRAFRRVCWKGSPKGRRISSSRWGLRRGHRRSYGWGCSWVRTWGRRRICSGSRSWGYGWGRGWINCWGSRCSYGCGYSWFNYWGRSWVLSCPSVWN